MRVIAGKARSLHLKTIEGNDTRPTTDRIKETLFNMINDKVYNSKFLDLFSGSGAIGIEAISRGAEKAVFVECNRKAVECIKDNLEFTKLADNAEIYTSNVETALKMLEGKYVFDIVFMDPPYNNEWEKKILQYLSNSTIINSDTLIIVEASKETQLDYLDVLGYSVIKDKIYKTNQHFFLNMDKNS